MLSRTKHSYTKLLEEEDEIRIFPEYLNKFVYAVGTSNEFGYHGQRGFLEIEIDDHDHHHGHDHDHEESEEIGAGNSTDNNSNNKLVAGRSDTRVYWALHGVLMTATWAICVPVAIGLNLLRGMLSVREDLRSRIICGLNGLALICTCTGFALALYAVQVESSITSTGLIDSPDEASTSPNASNSRRSREELHGSIGFLITALAVLHTGFAILRPHSLEISVNDDEQAALVGHEMDETDDDNDDECPEKSDMTTVSDAGSVWKMRLRFVYGILLLGLAWCSIGSGIAVFAHRYDEE